MWIAFRKGSTNWLGQLIRDRTGSPYSHCEVVLSGGPGKMSACFGASKADGLVRSKSLVLSSGNWDCVPVHVQSARLDAIINGETGKPYDNWGLWLWGTPFASAQDKNKWFCSELCAYVLDMPSPWRYSPGSLYAELTRPSADE